MPFSFAFPFGPTILAAILAIAILILGGWSVVFLYHWRTYGMGGRLAAAAPVIYLTGAAALCAFAIISFLAIR